MKRHKGKLIASFLITLGIWLTLHKGGLKIVPEGGDFHAVRWWIVPCYIVTLVGTAWFRSIRWRFLLRAVAEVPKKRLFTVSMVGFGAILMMPFRIGEFVRPYMLYARQKAKQDEKPISLTAATSSVVAERIIDGLYVSVVLVLALLLVPTIDPLPDRVVGIPVSVKQVRMSGYAMFGLFSVAAITIATFYFARAWAHKATLLVVGKISTPLAERLAGMAEKLADGLQVFGRGRDFLGFLFETSIYWGLNACGMWLLAWGCGVTHANGSTVTFGEACTLMGMLSCAVIIPGPPGMLGVFQAGVYSGMTMFYPTSIVTGPGAAYVFLMYASQIAFQLLAAALGLLAEGTSGLKVLEEASDGAHGTKAPQEHEAQGG